MEHPDSTKLGVWEPAFQVLLVINTSFVSLNAVLSFSHATPAEGTLDKSIVLNNLPDPVFPDK